MVAKHFVAILSVVGFAATLVVAQMSDSDRATIAAYQATIQSAESGIGAGRIEAAFTALRSVSAALTRNRGGNSGNLSILESLSNNDFNTLKVNLPGAFVNREEVVYIEPDPDYFLKLAAAHGDSADQKFFAALKATYPQNIWPIYLEPQTDYSGCTAYGLGSLVETYRVWSEFQSVFPNRYVAAARKEILGVSDEFTQATCACQDASSVEREFQLFLDTFRASPLRARIAERLMALRAGKSDFRFRCHSG